MPAQGQSKGKDLISVHSVFAGVFPLVSYPLHDLDSVAAIGMASIRPNVQLQVDFNIGYCLYLGELAH